jgi:CBS domain-containing protein
MLRVKHLLGTKGNRVWCVEPEEPVLRAIQMMADHHIGALPVVRGTELVGVVSERDYARKVILLGRSSEETAVWEIMSSPVISVTPETTVHDCMQIMTDKRIRHLPVLDNKELVGIISIGDLVRAVIEEQQETITQLERFITG